MKTLICSLALLAIAGCDAGTTGSATPTTEALQALPQVSTPAYTLEGSGPIVVVLAGNMADTLISFGAYDYSTRLKAAGFSILTLDLPCHGLDADHSSNKALNADPLLCWATRIASGDRDIFLKFCSGLSDVLDSLNQPVAGIIGISRGAYIASTCAAYDDRIKNIGAIIPLTDLNYLSEFKGLEVEDSMFGLEQFYPELRTKHILVRIGKDDTRVGTQNAQRYADAVGAEIQLLDTVGHSAPEDGTTIQWLIDQQ